jgi:alkanesulfonate monooxygenase SsuD/methylene tetrahydromethanopterin reductase-like flavin-dependent oxidoreductase (luciferase family)
MGFADRRVLFGFGVDSADQAGMIRNVRAADALGLDLFSMSDHPYLATHLDAYACLGYLLGQTSQIAGFANVTNLPTRPPALLARNLTALSALSEGRVLAGMGAGGRWERIADLGVPRLPPSAAVEAFEEGMTLLRLLTSPGPTVTFTGKHYSVTSIAPVPVASLPIWTGSVGPRSLAATGRVADGWIPGHAADWLSARYRSSRPLIDEAALSAGRSTSDVRTVFNLPGRITVTDVRSSRDEEGRWTGGSVRQWVDELISAVMDHGAGGFILFSATQGSVDPLGLEVWCNEIVPAVRQALAA